MPSFQHLIAETQRARELGVNVERVEQVVAAARRRAHEALSVAVALDLVAPVAGRVWHPVCCWCVDALEVHAELEIPAYRINLDTSHDTGPCSMCPASGRDTLVASIPGTPREMIALLNANKDNN